MTEPSPKSRRVFLGLRYTAPYQERFSGYLPLALRAEGWTPVLPLIALPGGVLLDRIATMIRSCDRCIFDVSIPNQNVWFELGIALALRKQCGLTCDTSPSALPDLLRGAWLLTYKGDAGCRDRVLEFLGSPDPAEVALDAPTRLEPRSAVVIGEDPRARGVERELERGGWTFRSMRPGASGSAGEIVSAAVGSGATIAVQPEGPTSWITATAVAGMIALGASHGAGCRPVLAAGVGEPIPSDCSDLTVRGAARAALARAVRQRLDVPPAPAPIQGTSRPTVPAGVGRKLSEAIAHVLSTDGVAALDAELGFGKTMTVSQAVDTVGWPTGWLTAQADWSLSNLVEAIVTTLGAHAPAFGWWALSATRAVADGPPPGTDRGARLQPASLGEMLARDAGDAVVSGPVLLVLDDAHALTADGAAVVSSLMRSRPSWLHFLVAGRGLPGPLQAETIAARVGCWRAPELAFALDETKTFIHQAVPTASDLLVDALQHATAGWPAAIALGRLWLLAHPEASLDELMERLRGDRQTVYQLLASDHFNTLSSDTRDDLLRLALPSVVGPEEASLLLGARGAARVRQLALGPHFMNEENAGLFRFHTLFRQFLQQRWIEERGRPDLLKEKRAVAVWYRDRGESANAFGVATECEAWDIAEAAVTPILGLITSHGDGGLLVSMLDRLPIEMVRGSRPLRGAWSRGLSYIGDPRDLEEAIGLAEMPGASPAAQATADIDVAEIRFQRGAISDDEFAAVCDGIADRLDETDLAVIASARLHSLGARTVHAAEPDRWPPLLEEALAVADLAEVAGLSAGAAIALSQAGDLLNRIAQTIFTKGAFDLRIRQGLGAPVPLPIRAATVRQILDMQAQVAELFRRANSLAEESGSEVTRAIVALDYARMLAFDIGNTVFLSGVVDDADRSQAKKGIGLALWAAEVFADRGMGRSVAIAYKIAAEVAVAIDDQEARDQLSAHAEQLAGGLGFEDISIMARSLRERPTPLEVVRTPVAPLNQWSQKDLDSMVDELIDGTGAPPHVASGMRAVLATMVRDDVALDAMRQETCRHLLLLSEKSGPTIGGLPILQPNRRATCRLLGTTMLRESVDGAGLAKEFISEHCLNCPYRAPADASTDLHLEGGDDDEIYRPLQEFIQTERQVIDG